MRTAACLRLLSSVAVIMAALASSGCPGPVPKWQERFEGDADLFRVTLGAEIVDSRKREEILEDLEKEAVRKALSGAVQQIVADMNPAESTRVEDERFVRDRITSRADVYVADKTIEDLRDLGNGRAVQMTVVVNVNRPELLKRLAELGILTNQTLRTILAVRNKTAGSNPLIPETEMHLDDLAENMSRELYGRGYQPTLWTDVRIAMAKELDAGNPDLEAEVVNFVEDSEWRDASDERYGIEMVLLRKQGRMLVGMSIQEIDRRGIDVHTTIRVDVYDLLNRRSLGSKAFSASRPIGGDTLLACSNQLIESTSRSAILWACDELQESQIREGRRRMNSYVLKFDGFSAEDRNRIEETLLPILSEDAGSTDDGARLTVSVDISRDPVPVRKEIELILEFLALPCEPTRRDGTEMTFARRKD